MNNLKVLLIYDYHICFNNLTVLIESLNHFLPSVSPFLALGQMHNKSVEAINKLQSH